MSKNGSLNNASKAKEDEFYTQLSDIENELKHYREQFRGKSIFCNCDDPYESNFFKYFAMNFNELGLKKLTAVSYVGSPVAQTQLRLFLDSHTPEQEQAFKIEITEVDDYNNDGAVNLLDVEYLLQNDNNVKTLLKGNGDFRSPESIEILKDSDIIVTNPPFSLFRPYLAQLMEYDKQFIIIGSKNAIAYKEVFEWIVAGRIWLGVPFNGGNAYFKIPETNRREWANGVFDEETGLVKFRNVGWYTNMDFAKRHETIDLYSKYSPDKYPKYDTYNAINVEKVTDIPYDYDGVMGVPITFMDRYNPDQFEILGLDRYVADNPNFGHRFKIAGKETYARILIRNRRPEKAK